MESVRRLFEEGKREAIDRQLFRGWAKHVKGLEERQWEVDERNEEVEPIFIYIGDDDEEEDIEDHEEEEEEEEHHEEEQQLEDMVGGWI